MFRNIPAAMAAFFLSFPAGAEEMDDAEVSELRERVRQLEERLDAQETQKSQEAVDAQQTQAAAAAPLDGSSDSSELSGNAFNPSISLIIDAKYRNLEQDPETYEIGGFVPGGGHGHGDEDGHGSGAGERGFSLDESELTISANIDPYWYGYFTAGISDGEIDIEEAWIQNSGFIPGVIAKAGRFFSGTGYINQQHPHAWDFADAPLVQQVFNGGNLADDGLQVRYVAPTPLFLELGLEAGSGTSFPGSESNKNGANAGAVFLNLGGDVGFSNSYLVGVSYRETEAQEREYDDEDSTGAEIENIFSDLKSKTWGASFVWKWAPYGDPSIRNFKFQAEYFQRTEDGSLGYDLDEATETFAQEGPYSSDQNGWYAQAVYQFMPRWRVGVRYDLLDSGTLEYSPITDGSITRDDLHLLREHKPERTTLMVDFSSSEFARFRLQFAQDKARFDQTDNQVIFQYVVSLGAHGAHKF